MINLYFVNFYRQKKKCLACKAKASPSPGQASESSKNNRNNRILEEERKKQQKLNKLNLIIIKVWIGLDAQAKRHIIAMPIAAARRRRRSINIDDVLIEICWWFFFVEREREREREWEKGNERDGKRPCKMMNILRHLRLSGVEVCFKQACKIRIAHG